MKVGFRVFYWVVAILFLMVTLGEAGFFAEAEGVIAGKKTFRIWGLPTGRRLLIKYQEPAETDPARTVPRYDRIPVTHSIYETFKKGDKLEHYKFSFVFFRNDESVTFSWDNTVDCFHYRIGVSVLRGPPVRKAPTCAIFSILVLAKKSCSILQYQRFGKSEEG